MHFDLFEECITHASCILFHLLLGIGMTTKLWIYFAYLLIHVESCHCISLVNADAQTHNNNCATGELISEVCDGVADWDQCHIFGKRGASANASGSLSSILIVVHVSGVIATKKYLRGVYIRVFSWAYSV